MIGFFGEFWRRRAAGPPEGPLRDDLLGADRLDDRALAIAARFTVDTRSRPQNVLPRLEENARALAHAHRVLASDVRAGNFVTSASEWFLDNFHLIVSQIANAERNLPRGYYRRLPRLAGREHHGRARIYAIAIELLRHSDSRIDQSQLESFLDSYQRVAPLTIGELWAWPSMLTLALVENLRRLADDILRSRRERVIADDYVAQAETGRHAAWTDGTPIGSLVQLLLRTRESGRTVPLLQRQVQTALDERHMTPEDAVRHEHQRQA